ncbi:hypothetical protein ACFSF3_06360 [Vibrio chagasii]
MFKENFGVKADESLPANQHGRFRHDRRPWLAPQGLIVFQVAIREELVRWVTSHQKSIVERTLK